MRNKPDKHFALAICDPPYGIGDDLLTSGGTWASKYKAGDAKWDIAPDMEYFNELFRISQNQIIWGGNYFNLGSTRGYIIWDKKTHMPTMADCEFAWTSFDRNAKIVKQLRSGNQTGEDRIHICQKPIDLYRWLLQNYAKPGDNILDTHGGSMSSAIACHMEGYDLDICEIDKEYFDAGLKRFNNYKSQLTLF
jgi:site-specific DNA-methyltransferase (adenine-specific)